MTADGWLRTGDQARISDGRLFIIGCLKDIIVLYDTDPQAQADRTAGEVRGRVVAAVFELKAAQSAAFDRPTVWHSSSW
jgi:hypothetical protein